MGIQICDFLIKKIEQFFIIIVLYTMSLGHEKDLDNFLWELNLTHDRNSNFLFFLVTWCFDIFKFYNICLQRYRDSKISVCVKFLFILFRKLQPCLQMNAIRFETIYKSWLYSHVF